MQFLTTQKFWHQHVQDWLESGLMPAHYCLQHGLNLETFTLHADETPVSQLEPGSGKTRKAYLWAYRSNDLQLGPRIVAFDYQPGRSGAHARRKFFDLHKANQIPMALAALNRIAVLYAIEAEGKALTC